MYRSQLSISLFQLVNMPISLKTTSQILTYSCKQEYKFYHISPNTVDISWSTPSTFMDIFKISPAFLVDICWLTPATCFHFLAYSLNLFPFCGVLPVSHFHGKYALDSIPTMETSQGSKPQNGNRLLE